MMKDIKEHDEALNQTLLASVPGLVNSTNGDSQQALAPAISTSDDRYSSAGRHRRLIPASAFNITTLFQPTSALLARAIEIIPPGYENETAQFGGGLEDFVVKVFLPQLEEKVTASFQQAVGGEFGC
jgi:exocyst complex component 4